MWVHRPEGSCRVKRTSFLPETRKAEFDGACLLIPLAGGSGRRIVNLGWVLEQLGLHNATLSRKTKCVCGGGGGGRIGWDPI